MKSSIIKIIISLVFLALFNTFFFLLGGIQHTTTEWVSYGFIHAAYLMLLLTPLFCIGNPKGVSVQTGSLYLRATFYFFTELIVGVAFLIAKPETLTWPLVVQAILAAVFLILQLASVLANDASNAALKQQKTESIQIQTLVLRLRNSMQTLEDENLRKHVKRCVDLLDASPLESFSEIADTEVTMQGAVDILCFDIDSGMNAETIIKDAKNLIIAISKRNSAITLHRRSKQ